MIGGKEFFFPAVIIEDACQELAGKKIAAIGKRDLILLMEPLNRASEGKIWKVMIQAYWKRKPDNPLPISSLYPKAFPDDNTKLHAFGKWVQ